MRIIALKLKTETKVLLQEVAKTHARRDTGFVEDLYSLMRLKGSGVPTKDRIKKMCDLAAKKTSTPAMVLAFVANKRALLFKEIVKMPYFHAVSKIPNTIQAVERFLVFFIKLHNKIRQAQCVTCPLMQKCDFGQQYGSNFVDITHALDPDYSKKVHPDCPELPQIESANQIAVSMQQYNEMLAQENAQMAALSGMPSSMDTLKKAEEKFEEEDVTDEGNLVDELSEEDFDQEDRGGPIIAAQTFGGSTDLGSAGDFCGGILNMTEQFIDNINSAQLNIYELGKKFSLALKSKKKDKFKPTPKVDRSRKEKKMESVSDLSKVVPSQHGLPKEVFDAKADRKQLNVHQNLEKESEKQLLYLMVDNSVSMDGQLPGAKHLLCSRGVIASVLGIALSRHVAKEGGIVFLRFFATGTTALHTTETEDDFKVIEHVFAKASYTGYGTNILNALTVASNDIEEGKRKGLKIAKSELLLITDGEDNSLNAANVREATKGIEFCVLDVAGKKFRSSAVLKSAAKSFYKVDETQLDVNKIVEQI